MTTVLEEASAAVKPAALAATSKALLILIFYLTESLCACICLTRDKSIRRLLPRLETSIFSEGNVGTQEPNPPHTYPSGVEM